MQPATPHYQRRNAVTIRSLEVLKAKKILTLREAALLMLGNARLRFKLFPELAALVDRLRQAGKRGDVALRPDKKSITRANLNRWPAALSNRTWAKNLGVSFHDVAPPLVSAGSLADSSSGRARPTPDNLSRLYHRTLEEIELLTLELTNVKAELAACRARVRGGRPKKVQKS